jgi:uncharacterized protein YjbI with pentapeptide repeats
MPESDTTFAEPKNAELAADVAAESEVVESLEEQSAAEREPQNDDFTEENESERLADFKNIAENELKAGKSAKAEEEIEADENHETEQVSAEADDKNAELKPEATLEQEDTLEKDTAASGEDLINVENDTESESSDPEALVDSANDPEENLKNTPESNLENITASDTDTKTSEDEENSEANPAGAENSAGETDSAPKPVFEYFERDLVLIDDLDLSDKEFLERIHARNPYSRLNPHRHLREISDWEELQKSRFLQILTGLAFVGFAGAIYFSFTLEELEKYKALKGYVMLNHELPKNYVGEVSAEIEELLERYHEIEKQKHHVKKNKFAEQKFMGDYYPQRLNIDDLVLILQDMDIGPVSRYGARFPDQMNLSGLDLRDVDFSKFKAFVQSNLYRANLTKVDNPEAVFRGAYLKQAKLNEANLTATSFIRAQIEQADFKGSTLISANLYAAKGGENDFSSASLIQANFKEAELKTSNFKKVIAFNTNFENASLEASDFQSADLRGANFKNCDLALVNFRGANLKNANFKGANLDGVNFSDADVEGANFEGASVVQARFGESHNFTEAQLSQTELPYRVTSYPKNFDKSRLSFRYRF